MAKPTTDYVNLIATNLRERYKSGFPILKELVQNADDAGATELAFGNHSGFADAADHPLLQGPALWVLNNGALPAGRPEGDSLVRPECQSCRAPWLLGQVELQFESVRVEGLALLWPV